ncbi:MAG: STAS domain-containing protein [Pseudomonadales bacterium]|nr:STAS domain-containing protein [Pseudomonadales bacterium]
MTDTLTLDLGERFTIAQVHDRHEALSGTLADYRQLTIDAGSVRDIDTAGLQYLLVLCHHFGEGAIHWQSVSDELLLAAALTDLDTALGISL